MKKEPIATLAHGLLGDLHDRLKQLEAENHRPVEASLLAFNACRKAMQELRRLLESHVFAGPEEEITFFKHVKPRLQSELIYYYEVFRFHAGFPRWGQLQQKAWFRKKLEHISRFFKKHREFCTYYNGGAGYFDAQYFLREHANAGLIPREALIGFDEMCCTAGDCLVAYILAYDRLEHYLVNEKSKYGSKKALPFSLLLGDWTGTKNALIELAYALYAVKVINNGKIKLDRIVKVFETIFNINLGNYSDSLVPFSLRKKEKAKFLDELKEGFINYLDDDSALRNNPLPPER